MPHVDPDQHTIAAMCEADPNEPVKMLNLLRFRERALNRFGDEDGDLAILVGYPTRQHLSDKISDPKYQEIAKVRAAALEDSRLIELTQP